MATAGLNAGLSAGLTTAVSGASTLTARASSAAAAASAACASAAASAGAAAGAAAATAATAATSPRGAANAWLDQTTHGVERGEEEEEQVRARVQLSPPRGARSREARSVQRVAVGEGHKVLDI